MKTIAVVNQKGGCGKTTTAVNLAAALAEQQQNVLLMDLDPQAHATIGFGHDPDDLKHTLYDAATRAEIKLTDVLLPTRMERLTVAPANVMLASADVELARAPNRELILGNLLKSVRDRYDVCVMDCAPSFGILTISALVASTDVIVPVQPHYYSVEGLRRVLETIRLIRERFHACSAGNVNVLLTLVEDRTTLSKQIQAQMRELFGSMVFQAVIHNNVRLCEAPSAGESILEYAPQSRGAVEYRALAAEVLGNVRAVESVGHGATRRGIQKNLSELFGGLPTTTPRRSKPTEPPIDTDLHIPDIDLSEIETPGVLDFEREETALSAAYAAPQESETPQ